MNAYLWCGSAFHPCGVLAVGSRHICRDLVNDPPGGASPSGETGLPFEAVTLCHGTEVASEEA